MDHAQARTVFGRFVVGAPVPDEDLKPALAHAADCAACARELGAEPWDAPVDPAAVFDRALTTALRTHPEGIARARAAEQLGTRGLASPAALMALADAAERDPEPRVREAARRARDALGGAGGRVPRGPAPA